LTHKSFIPRHSRPYLSAQNKFELPSNMETMSSSSMPGKTHSFLDQTPEPYGQDVLPTRSSKSVFQYSVYRGCCCCNNMILKKALVNIIIIIIIVSLR